jgi:hypothetical protein
MSQERVPHDEHQFVDGMWQSSYPALRRPVERSGLAAFFAAGFFPSIGSSISF